MHVDVVMLGYGPVGRATVAGLLAAGRTVRVAQRSRPTDLPAAASFVACDVLDAASVAAACAGAGQVAVAIGFAYRSAVWRSGWPRAMANLLDACAAHGQRMVFFDNLYMLGPQHDPLVETMPLTDQGHKPAVRAAITRMWQDDRRVKVAALRAPDFYGPGVLLSHLGETGLAAIARGKSATFVFSPDQPHDYAYVPDIGRAMITLLNADDSAFGRAWHMPCAPTETSREILARGAAAMGTRLRVTALPRPVLALLAPIVPMLGEMSEMRFQWDRPYQVDASAWRARFWDDVTPFDRGVAETVASFRD